MQKFRLVGLIALAILASACSSNQADTMDPAFAKYIKAFTGGVVPDETALRIELAAPVPMERQGDGLFSFKPSLPGSSRWLSPTVVEFVPDAPLKEETVYEGTFKVSKVVDVTEKECQSFRFKFRTAPKTAVLSLDGITIQSDARLQGSLTLSAPAAPEDIQISVNPDTPVTLTGEGTSWRFETAGITRGGMDIPVTVQVKVNGFRDASPVKAVIPASGVFKVIDTRITRTGNPCVEVRFSEPLASNAGREGFFQLSDVVRQTVDIRDNCARIYFEGAGDDLSLHIFRGVRSASGTALGEDFYAGFPAEDPVPAVTIPFEGNIIPDEDALVLPFRAVNLSAVDLKVIKVYENNVLLFLQENDLDESSSLRRSGRLVYSRQIPLNIDGDRDLHQWNDFSVDLSGLFKREPGAIYRIKLSFRQEYSLYGGKPAPQMIPVTDGDLSPEEEEEWDTQYAYWWDSDYDWNLYDWEDQDNPDKPTFYMDSDRFPTVNLLYSNLGIVANYAGGKTVWVSVTDINDTDPLSGVELEAYDFQLQRIGSAKTDGKGLAEIAVTRKPFVILARKGQMTGYLRMKDGYEKSLSRFDVSGQTVAKGLKAFVYGERGVWRPGDTLHVTMILADKARQLPEGHPAALELYTPQGQFYTRMTATGQDGFYAFPVATSADDPTGLWNAYIKVGGSSFHKGLRIETIRPNRLKVDLDIPGGILTGGSRTAGKLTSSWLTGVPANGLKAHATMTLSKGPSTFKGFDGYIFRNPAASFETSEHELFKTVLSPEGTAEPAFNLPAAKDAPGLLSAFIVTSVEEGGGDESFTTQTLTYSPFPAYVGVKLPGNDLETGKSHTVQVAVVDAAGNRLSGRQLEYRVFKLQWSWWWEDSPYEIQNYVNGQEAKPVASGTLVSGSKDVTFTLRAEDADWGRYLVVVRDIAGGHLSGRTVIIDEPGYAGRAGRENPDAATMLTFSTDKDSYLAGEKATVYIPSAAGGRALVSLENAAGVISRQWVSTDKEKDATCSFTVTPEMAPNFYVHITLVQPYAVTSGSQPLRLYGVKRVMVENPDSHLEPVVNAPETVEPEKAFKVQVSEKSGKPMTYTLAVVDEGLLDLTAFKTPSPWEAMYRTEALGVKTWDLFDQIIGYHGGIISPMLSIGGDEENIRAARKDNRFNPVVQFLGPFTLKKGTATHEVKLPMYIGSLRVMVVAGHDGAYGSADRTVTVKSPLMVLSSLPAQVCTGEQVVLPVNVFALSDDIKNAKVTVKATGALEVDGAASASASFAKAGDQMVRFALKAVGEGPAQVTVQASGASHKASETIDIQIVNPNPETVTIREETLAGGKTVAFDAGDHSTLELAGFPAVDASGLYRTMKNYPYNCTEQISARGLTLLHLLPQLSDADAAEAKELLPGIIHQIYARQRSDGGFSYWSGGTVSDSWVSSMAGQFLSEAAAAGIEVQSDVLANWKRFQTNLSQAYRKAGNAAFSELDESYRLYTLAVAGDPASGAMNRLKESGDLNGRAAWMLAAAYAVAGKAKTAGELIDTIEKVTDDDRTGDFTYGSSLRDKSVILQALVLADRLGEALPTAQELAGTINKGWYSTQDAAFAAMAMDRLAAKVGVQAISATVDGKNVTTAKSVYVQPVSGQFEVTNTSDAQLYATLTTVSRAPAGTMVPAAANGLQISVSYQNTDGTALKVASIPQGTEFTAVVKVSNPTSRNYTSLALSERIPSGWEILNDRMRGGAAGADDGYRDIRDDRCNWFFDLPHGSSRTFTMKLRAAYEGTYTLPSITCSAMYDPHVAANTASGTASVTR